MNKVFYLTTGSDGWEPVLQAGHVYVGVPPLYKVEAGRKAQYCYDDAELAEKTQGLAPGSYTLQRFKVRRQTNMHVQTHSADVTYDTGLTEQTRGLVPSYLNLDPILLLPHLLCPC